MKAHRLSETLQGRHFVTAPGVFDGFSARLADSRDFGALYLTGYGVSASLLGQPDAGFLNLSHMADRVRTICDCISTPLIADADTGFGGTLNVAATVRAYEAAGAAAIQLEDQVFPKRCGHTPGREVIPLDQATDKLKAALDARKDAAFKIIARTDARTSKGLDAALERAEAFHDAGADILFVESPEGEEELDRIAKAIPGSLQMANMVEGGRTPWLAPPELEAMGFALAIYPLIGLAAAGAGLTSAYKTLSSGVVSDKPEMTFAELNRTVGFEDIWQKEAQKN